MCLKRARLLPASWSIVTRLTLFFSLSAALIQALISIYLYIALQHTFLKNNRQFLLREIQVLNQIVQRQPLDRALLMEEQQEGLELPTGKYYSRVLDAHQHTLSETPGMPAILREAHVLAALSQPDEQRLHMADGRHFFILSHAVQGQTAATYQMALDVSSQAHRLVEYQRTLLLAFMFGVLLSAWAAFLIAKYGLKPLAMMAGEVSAIGAFSLNQRLTAADYPHELADLVSSFNHMLERLHHAFEQLQQFSADIAHELRTPVNNLIGESEVALSRVRSLDDYQQLIASNLDEYRRLSQIIEALLFLARADNTEIMAKKQPLDAASQVAAVFSYFDALAEEKNIRLICSGHGLVFSDMQLLRRVLSNLVHNSLKYVTHGGEVRVHIEQAATATLITVQDNGAGIESQHLPKIFDRFYRASASRAEQGTGLGLAIVKSIMTLHDGSIAIDSRAGYGTTVTLTFKHALDFQA